MSNTLISSKLMDGLLAINHRIVLSQITHPVTLALVLEELATDAWEEARLMGFPTWEEAEDLQPSIRIDP